MSIGNAVISYEDDSGSMPSKCPRTSSKLCPELPKSMGIESCSLQRKSKDFVLQNRFPCWPQISSFCKKQFRSLPSACGRLKRERFRKNSFIFVTFLLIFLSSLISPSTAKNFKNGLSDTSRFRRRTDNFRRRTGTQCERITISLCMDIGYNFTDIALSPSNMLEQEEASEAVKQFHPIIDVKCAEEMKQLVCAIYAPICMPNYPHFLPPCRDICERAKKKCGPILEKYQFGWPELLMCEDLPSFSEPKPCLHFNKSKEEVSLHGSEEPVVLTTEKMKVHPQNFTSTLTTTSSDDQCTCHCHHPFISLTEQSHPLYNKVDMGRTPNCVMTCRSPYFSRSQLTTLQSWITSLSIVCFIVTSMTVGTFLIDASRFKYPERSIIFLSLCYMFVSVGFLIRVAAGHGAVACGWQSDHVQYPHTAVSFLCGLVFFLIYFFGMAGALWWVILSFTWLLVSGLKWGNEAILNYSNRFHLVAWLIPIIQTLTVFGLWYVDGDAVSGICFVGNQDINNAYYFVVVPMMLYLGLGSIFSLFGFFDLCRIRNSIKKAKKKTNSFDKMFGRMGFFSVMYMVFTTILLSCYFYELLKRDEWANAKNCRKPNSAGFCSLESGAEPDLSVFIVKYSMTLLIGITNGVWICSKKTIYSWKHFYEKTFTYVCGSGGFVSWFKRKNKKASSKIFRTKISSPQSSEQTSVELVPESSLSGMDPKNEESASTLIPTEDASSRQDSTIRRDTTCSSGSSHLTHEDHPKHSKRRRKSFENKFKRTCSCTETADTNEESRVQLLNCVTARSTPVGNTPDSSQMTSLMSVPCKRSSAVDNEKYVLNFQSQRLNKCSKQCVVYCSHPSAVTNHFERSSPTSMSVDNENKIQHVHYHHHHHHHITPKSGVYLHAVHQSCPRSCEKGSRLSTSERKSFHRSNFLLKS